MGQLRPAITPLTLVALYRHPGGAFGQARRIDPGPQQHGLAAARRRGEHRHPLRLD